MPQAASLTKLNLSGNRLGAKAIAALSETIRNAESPTSLFDIDISRNPLVGDGGAAAEDALLALVKSVADCPSVSILGLSRVGITDEVGGRIAVALTGRDEMDAPRRALTKLDLSHNALGEDFAKAMLFVGSACPKLASLDISHNPLGASGGKSIAKAAAYCPALRIIDLTRTNLCNCTPRDARERQSWTGDAVNVLCATLLTGPPIQVSPSLPRLSPDRQSSPHIRPLPCSPCSPCSPWTLPDLP